MSSNPQLHDLILEEGMPYKIPGVYVSEKSVFPPAVTEVASAVPAFIGYTETAPERDSPLPTRIESLAEFKSIFGGPCLDADIEVRIRDVLSSEGTDTRFEPVAVPEVRFRMYYGMQMFYANGGGGCYVVSAGTYSDGGVAYAPLQEALAALEKVDEATIITFPDAVAMEDADSYYALMEGALAQCSKLKDRVAVIDVHKQDVQACRDKIGSDSLKLKYGAVYHPWLETSLRYEFDEDKVRVAEHTVDDHGEIVEGALKGKLLSCEEIRQDRPELYHAISDAIGKAGVTLPPGSAMAGVYARVDRSRGCWKAPANVALAQVRKPTIDITRDVQNSLNIDSVAGKSINAIRAFTGRGTLVWGARTLAGNDNEWRYIPVRRFFNMVEESLKKSAQWAVFEPNDANTWRKVQAMIENYLTQKWRDGALRGAKPGHAFFVKVGLGQTMTAQDMLEGRMIVEIGLAVVRPAEFIVLRLSLKMSEA